VVAGGDPVVTPTAGQVAGIRGLGPPEDEVVVAGREADLRIQVSVGLRVPLDLGVGRGDAGRHSDEAREVTAAQKREVAAAVNADHLIDELYVVVRPDRAGA